MKGDVSRRTFDRSKGYTKVLQQQGRVTVDADWNEQADITDALRRDAMGDIVGPAGTPADDDGFRVLDAVGGPGDFGLSPGRIWVDGLPCETGEALTATRVQGNQLFLDRPAIDGRPLGGLLPASGGEWIEVRAVRHDGRPVWAGNRALKATLQVTGVVEGELKVTVRTDNSPDFAAAAAGAASATAEAVFLGWVEKERVEVRRVIRYKDQPFLAPAPEAPDASHASGSADYLVFADVWERHVTSLEDRGIRDVALGGPDTATRVQAAWGIRCERLGTPACDAIAAGGLPSTSPSRGRLTASVDKEDEDPNQPCAVGDPGGFAGVENRCYRVEIHKGGALGDPAAADAATFKWSRDNGSLVFAVDAYKDATGGPNHRILTLAPMGRADATVLKPGDWLEILDLEAEMAGKPGTMVQVAPPVDSATDVHVVLRDGETLKPFEGAEAHKKRVMRARRWDHVAHVDATADFAHPQDAPAGKYGTVHVGAGPILLEHGVKVQFSGKEFRTGDWWTFSARTLTRKIDELQAAPPMGVRHRYAPLGILRWTKAAASGSWSKQATSDCRSPFRPLTARAFTLRQAGGDGQEAGPLLSLPCPVTVAVEDAWGQPVRDVAVKFDVTAANGTVSTDPAGADPAWGPSSVPAAGPIPANRTDVDGLAKVYWRMPAGVGAREMKASIVPSDLPPYQAVAMPQWFRAEARCRLRVLGGDGQEGLAGETLANDLGVVVEDPHGRPVPGQQVTFSILAQAAGGTPSAALEGSLAPAPAGAANPTPPAAPATSIEVTTTSVTATTPVAGIAAVRWLLGNAGAGSGLGLEATLPAALGGEKMRCRFRATVKAVPPAAKQAGPFTITRLDWDHAQEVPLAHFMSSLRVWFSSAPRAADARPENFVVTLDKPDNAPDGDGDGFRDWDGYVPFVLRGTVAQDPPLWAFNPRDTAALAKIIRAWAADNRDKPGTVLCRVSIKGSGIVDGNGYALTGPILPRFSEASRSLGKAEAAMEIPRVEGLDFESWFRIRVAPAEVPTIKFTKDPAKKALTVDRIDGKPKWGDILVTGIQKSYPDTAPVLLRHALTGGSGNVVIQHKTTQAILYETKF